MKYIKKYNENKYEEDWEEDWEEIELEGNEIYYEQLKYLIKIIDEVVENNNYDKYDPPEINLHNLGIMKSKRIYVFGSDKPDAKKVFMIEYFETNNGYLVDYNDRSGMVLKNGKFDIIKMFIEQWK